MLVEDIKAHLQLLVPALELPHQLAVEVALPSGCPYYLQHPLADVLGSAVKPLLLLGQLRVVPSQRPTIARARLLENWTVWGGLRSNPPPILPFNTSHLLPRIPPLVSENMDYVVQVELSALQSTSKRIEARKKRVLVS